MQPHTSLVAVLALLTVASTAAADEQDTTSTTAPAGRFDHGGPGPGRPDARRGAAGAARG